jgi:hypothetical protein
MLLDVNLTSRSKLLCQLMNDGNRNSLKKYQNIIPENYKKIWNQAREQNGCLELSAIWRSIKMRTLYCIRASLNSVGIAITFSTKPFSCNS